MIDINITITMHGSIHSVHFTGKIILNNESSHEKEHFIRYLQPKKLEWPISVKNKPFIDQTFYQSHIKEIWSFYKRPNWKYYLGNILKNLVIN